MLRTLVPSLLLVCCFSSLAPAQSAPFAVGRRDVGWTNTTGNGSATLAARVHYPSVGGGSNTAVLPRAGGWPAIVFLHGFATLGNLYSELGDDLAEAGYIVVMSNTAQFDNQLQELDGRALYSAVIAANSRVGDPFEAAIDTARIGLAGHSMGGGNTANVLSTNPGYRCGFAFAPTNARGTNAAAVATPFGIVAATGDTIAPWRLFAEPLYQGLTGYTALKHLYLMNGDAGHNNVTGLFRFGSTSRQVYERSRATALAFFSRYLLDEAAGLENVVGVAARSEGRLVELRVEVEAPEVWPAEALRIGLTTRLSIAAEPGPCGLLAALSTGSTPTPFGELRLDLSSVIVALTGSASAERRFDVNLSLPADPALIGVRVPVQAFGAARDSAIRLGAATELVVEN